MAPEGAPQGSATAQPRPFPCPCPRGPADSPPPSAGVDHRPAVCLATVKVPVQPPLPAQTKPISHAFQTAEKISIPTTPWVVGEWGRYFYFSIFGRKKTTKIFVSCIFVFFFLAIPGHSWKKYLVSENFSCFGPIFPQDQNYCHFLSACKFAVFQAICYHSSFQLSYSLMEDMGLHPPSAGHLDLKLPKKNGFLAFFVPPPPNE